MHLAHALPLLLRLRGGDDNGLRLTRDEIVGKLNAVPTFCVMQEDGSIVSLPDQAGADGDECCTWFTDAAEAKHTLRRVCAANPDEDGLHLRCFGLGDALQMCGGWPGETSPSDGRQALKLQGPSAFRTPVEPQLIQALKQQGLAPGSWRLPVFIGEELAQGTPGLGGDAEGTMARLPVFLSPYDLKAVYERYNVPKHAYAKGPQVMDLRMLVDHMASEPKEYPNPWRAVEFVCSPDAGELAKELSQGVGAGAA